MQVLLLFGAIFHLLVHFLGPKWGDMHLTLREGMCGRPGPSGRCRKVAGNPSIGGGRGLGRGSEGLFWTFC